MEFGNRHIIPCVSTKLHMKKLLITLYVLFVSLTSAWARGYRPMSQSSEQPDWPKAIEPWFGLIEGLIIVGTLMAFVAVYAKARENDARRFRDTNLK